MKIFETLGIPASGKTTLIKRVLTEFKNVDASFFDGRIDMEIDEDLSRADPEKELENRIISFNMSIYRHHKLFLQIERENVGILIFDRGVIDCGFVWPTAYHKVGHLSTAAKNKLYKSAVDLIQRNPNYLDTDITLFELPIEESIRRHTRTSVVDQVAMQKHVLDALRETYLELQQGYLLQNVASTLPKNKNRECPENLFGKLAAMHERIRTINGTMQTDFNYERFKGYLDL